MARPRQYSDEDILEAAREAFLEHGPAVSTTVIAAKVGLSQSALFKRYGTKEQLMFEALAPPPSVAQWVADLQQGPDDSPLRGQIERIVARITAFFVEMVPRFAIMQSCGVSQRTLLDRYEVPPPVVAVRTVGAWFARAQAAGRVRDDLEPEGLALALLGPIQTRTFIQHIAGERFPIGGPDPGRDLVELMMGALTEEERKRC